MLRELKPAHFQTKAATSDSQADEGALSRRHCFPAFV